MSGPQIVRSLPMGKVRLTISTPLANHFFLSNAASKPTQGVTLNILRDESQSSTSLERWQAEAVYSGEAEPFVPLHWHTKHSEHITVREGRVEATMNGVKRIVSTGESIVIPAYTVHGFRGFQGERLVLRETAIPAGNYKAA